jgi:hypothetical protein
VFREAARLVLGEDLLSVDDDVEDPATAGNQLRLDSERLLQRGRQTGGRGQVVSTSAVGDDDVHEVFPIRSRTRGIRSVPK